MVWAVAEGRRVQRGGCGDGCQYLLAMVFTMVPERPEFINYASRMAVRPAAQRAEAKDKERVVA